MRVKTRGACTFTYIGDRNKNKPSISGRKRDVLYNVKIYDSMETLQNDKVTEGLCVDAVNVGAE